jgi:hypothetical protein
MFVVHQEEVVEEEDPLEFMIIPMDIIQSLLSGGGGGGGALSDFLVSTSKSNRRWIYVQMEETEQMEILENLPW